VEAVLSIHPYLKNLPQCLIFTTLIPLCTFLFFTHILMFGRKSEIYSNPSLKAFQNEVETRYNQTTALKQ
jgi:hypothetical protein